MNFIGLQLKWRLQFKNKNFPKFENFENQEIFFELLDRKCSKIKSYENFGFKDTGFKFVGNPKGLKSEKPKQKKGPCENFSSHSTSMGSIICRKQLYSKILIYLPPTFSVKLQGIGIKYSG